MAETGFGEIYFWRNLFRDNTSGICDIFPSICAWMWDCDKDYCRAKCSWWGREKQCVIDIPPSGGCIKITRLADYRSNCIPCAPWRVARCAALLGAALRDGATARRAALRRVALRRAGLRCVAPSSAMQRDAARRCGALRSAALRSAAWVQ